MSESWKNRLWSLLLVCTFAVVLSVCNKAINNSSGGSSSSGTAFADGSTVTISSQALPAVTAFMTCSSKDFDADGNAVWYTCDSSDTTSFQSITVFSNTRTYAIKHDDLVSSGFFPCPSQHGYQFCK